MHVIYRKYGKRVLDILLTLMGFIFLVPMIALIALLVYLKLGPQVFFQQSRPGHHGKPFILFKFRTLIDAYVENGKLLADDQRLTSFGSFLRSTSLDELPEFLNVLKGEMSIVGPRAYYPDELENQQNKHPETKKFVSEVLSVKPGITGLWQVSGRSEVHFDKRIALDAEYIKSISLLEDVKIICKTPLVMISGRGAV